MPKISVLQAVALATLLVGCSRPLLVVGETTPTANVVFKNNSSGTLQQFYFEDPVNCGEPKLLDYFLQPSEAKEKKIPAGKIITIWTSAFGLPAAPNRVAWCQPHAFSTNLVAGQSYQVSFEVNTAKEQCGTVLVSTSGQTVKRVNRVVSGPEVGGGGVMAGSFSCTPTDELKELVK